MNKIGHHPRKRGMMGQTDPIYACMGTNHVCYFISSCYILRLLEEKLIEVILEKKLDR